MLLKRLQTWPKPGIEASVCDGSKPDFRAALCRRRISIIENAVPYFPCLSQTPVPLRMSVSFCDQTIVCSHWFSQGRQHKHGVPGALRAGPLSRCPAEQLRGCLLSIVAYRTSLPSPLNTSDYLPTGLAVGIHHLLWLGLFRGQS